MVHAYDAIPPGKLGNDDPPLTIPPAAQAEGAWTELLPQKDILSDAVEFEPSEQFSNLITALPVTFSASDADGLVARMQAVPVALTSPTARATIRAGADI